MTKWEYRARDIFVMSFNEELNFEGQEGWELIHLEKERTTKEEQDRWFAVFKRPIEE